MLQPLANQAAVHQSKLHAVLQQVATDIRLAKGEVVSQTDFQILTEQESECRDSLSSVPESFDRAD